MELSTLKLAQKLRIQRSCFIGNARSRQKTPKFWIYQDYLSGRKLKKKHSSIYGNAANRHETSQYWNLRHYLWMQHLKNVFSSVFSTSQRIEKNFTELEFSTPIFSCNQILKIEFCTFFDFLQGSNQSKNFKILESSRKTFGKTAENWIFLKFYRCSE